MSWKSCFENPIEKTLVLSTAHMPSSRPDFGPFRISEHEYGYVVFLPNFVPDDTPKWLIPVVKMAHKKRATSINFDRDVEPVRGLRTWDW